MLILLREINIYVITFIVAQYFQHYERLLSSQFLKHREIFQFHE